MANQYAPTLEERFWSKVDKTTGCWLWTACQDDCGYGMFTYRNARWRSHRVSYLMHFGEFDLALKVRHTCDVPSCVRPDHLILGTQSDNMMDMVSRGRHGAQDANLSAAYVQWLVDHPRRSVDDLCQKGAHVFSEENTRIKPIGARLARSCRACERMTAKRDRIAYKVKGFVRGVDDRAGIVAGLILKIEEIGGCAYCDGPFECLDHVIPKSLGGSISIENINPSCNECNFRKGNRINGQIHRTALP